MQKLLTKEQRLQVYKNVRAQLLSDGLETGFCYWFSKALDKLGFEDYDAYFNSDSRKDLKRVWPEIAAYKPKTNWEGNKHYWWSSHKIGQKHRLKVIDAIIEDMTKPGPLDLTKDQVKEIKTKILFVYENLCKPYSLLDCAINSLRNYSYALQENGASSCGDINGGALLKYCNRELYEMLAKIDNIFGVLLPNGKITFHRTSDCAIYTFGTDENDTSVIPFTGVTGDQLTFDQFEKWRENFDFTCARKPM